MSRRQDDPILVAAFAQARQLEPTDSDVAAVLDRVAKRRRRLARPRSFARFPIGGLLTTAGAAAAVAVTVTAIVFLAHGRPRRTLAGSPPIPAATHGLISELAVLRRPQTAADRAVPWSDDRVERRSLDRPVPGLTRRVFTFPNGRGLFMVVLAHPTAIGAPPPLPARAGDGVALWSLCCNGVGEPAAWLRGHKQLVPEERGVPRSSAVYYAYSVVPDGVTRVKWIFAALHTSTRTWPQTTVWAKVQNNVAVARVLPFPLPVLSATWYAADGHIIASQTWTQNRRACKRRSNRCARYL